VREGERESERESGSESESVSECVWGREGERDGERETEGVEEVVQQHQPLLRIDHDTLRNSCRRISVTFTWTFGYKLNGRIGLALSSSSTSPSCATRQVV
jgi:hypothetical protein